MYAELAGDSKKQRIKSLCDNRMYQEYGTRFMPGKPHIRPAYYAQRVIFTKDIRELVLRK